MHNDPFRRKLIAATGYTLLSYICFSIATVAFFFILFTSGVEIDTIKLVRLVSIIGFPVVVIFGLMCFVKRINLRREAFGGKLERDGGISDTIQGAT